MTADRFVCPSEQRPDDFLTISDSRGASINFERSENGAVTVWIAAPGENDGYSVRLDEVGCQQITNYLRGGA